MENKDIKVALILGGTSPEREVSKHSSAAIYEALQNLNYKVVLIDPAYGENQPEKPEDFFADKDFAKLSDRNYIEAVNSKIFDEVDIAFIGLHGNRGEDGKIQSLLEFRGIRYTGSDVLSSSIAMDKAMSKILFTHYNIPTADWVVVEKNSSNPEGVQKIIDEKFGYPCVIKPSDQGSTFGLTVCKSSEDVKDALEFSFKFTKKTLVEDFIPGRELTVGIIEDKALPVLEIKPKHDLYDYECKYTKGMSEYEVPANIPKDFAEYLQEVSLKAFKAVGCSGYGRVDFKVNEKLEAFCLEVNTLPGMTSTSLVPKMAKAVGITFEQLIDRIIKLGL